ncbi:hypothetical protein PIB30_064176 [Stylosanthes scabra]|uniref:Uncharacterized protein n=1 Tax=Stylosanthes scabra TaxID=79078 RepID=A0ABU6YKD8_9FABA|nr:hypothetical protein [Stylosanthes scabra]
MSLSNHSSQFAHQETACILLLKELQKIWDDVGESDSQKDAMLLEIEQKCLELYKKKVDEAKAYRAQIQQEITDYEAEIAGICAAMGLQPPQFERKSCESLKKGRELVVLQLEETRKLKTERKKQFLEVLYQLQNISTELHGSNGAIAYLDENNLSLERLEELQRKLVQFQNEKANRLKQVSNFLNTLSSLCSVLGLDVKDKIGEICPSMVTSTATKEISDNTIKILSSEVKSLREVKIQRMQKLQNLATALLEMWNLMDTPLEEQHKFHSFTSKIAARESEFTEPNMLSIDSVIYVETEVRRLQQLKSTKMKELVLRKKMELEEICRSSHLIAKTVFPSENPPELLDSESINHERMFHQLEHQIEMAKEEARSRKEVLEKVEKWLAACQEESWLEEYNRDDNRYNAGRGAHLALKRAEKARAILSKISGMVDALLLKVKSWEKERGHEFLYEGSRLCSMLEDYITLRQDKENEKQRQRDQKKLKGQLIVEHETLFGSKPSPSKSGIKASRCSIGVASYKKISMGGAVLQDSRQSAIFEQPNKKGILSTPKGSIPSIRNANHATKPSGKDAPKAVGKSVKKTPYTAEKHIEIQSPLIRKPLSPISSSFISKANIPTNFQEDHRKSEMLTKTPPSSKPIVVVDEENMGLAVPTTPLTSVPMLLTATTPDTPSVTVYSNSGSTVATKMIKATPFEYSFEEVRAGYVLPKKTSA